MGNIEMEPIPIPDCPGYFADREGSIYSTRQGTIRRLKPGKYKDGYLRLVLYSGGGKCSTKKVHRLIARAFLGACEDLHVNHKNGIRSDNRVLNLEVVSSLENVRHSYEVLKTGIHGSRVGTAKLTEADVLEIRKLISDGMRYRRIAEMFLVSPRTIQHIRSGTMWKRVRYPAESLK